MNYKIFIRDKSYADYSIVNTETNELADITQFQTLSPLKEKMFSNDVFSFNIQSSEPSFKPVYSHIRSGVSLAGILVLENNKTFGRTENKKRNLYKCIPDDKHLPIFLVPYQSEIGFSKIFVNKYVVFKYESWKNTHPQGILVETLGNVNEHNVFFEYQLYCKSLHISLTQFTNKTRNKLLTISHNEYIERILKNPDFSIEDRRENHSVFTIDPHSSVDFDDGFSIGESADGTIKISIYIANVFFWLETLELWKSFSSRVSTIYLPDRKRPMLPTILSDQLCSLQEGESRFTFVMDMFWKPGDDYNKNPVLLSTQFRHAVIRVSKNYRYEEPELLYSSTDYERLFKITSKLDKHVTDSHDLVTYWMTFMNKMCGEKMAEQKVGIFRSVVYKNLLIYESIDKDISFNTLSTDSKRVIQTWNNTAGQYVVYDSNTSREHEFLNTKSYVHITSPIRRLVDLLNMMWFSRELGLLKRISNEAQEFFSNWMSKIDYINESMRAIRKVQTDCELIHRCFTTPELLCHTYEGVVFGKLVKNDGAIMYMVYLESIKILSRITIHEDIANYSRRMFKLFLFHDEDNLKKKIRLQLLEN
jgi:exoribonuclease R